MIYKAERKVRGKTLGRCDVVERRLCQEKRGKTTYCSEVVPKDGAGKVSIVSGHGFMTSLVIIQSPRGVQRQRKRSTIRCLRHMIPLSV